MLKDFLLNNREITAFIAYLIGFFITGIIIAIIGNVKATKNKKQWEADGAMGMIMLFWFIAIPAYAVMFMLIYIYRASIYLGRCIALKLKPNQRVTYEAPTPPVYRKPPLRP